MSFDKKTTSDDDPLLAKRPLFWSCVSCDIDVDKVNLLILVPRKTRRI